MIAPVVQIGPSVLTNRILRTLFEHRQLTTNTLQKVFGVDVKQISMQAMSLRLQISTMEEGK